MAKSYGQFCGLSRAADLLGNRWTMLILRDLAVSPLRFTELSEGLPGIPSNMLATRLKELEVAGVVERRIAPRGVAYGLSTWGSELVPALDALGRWGALRMTTPHQGDVVTDGVLATMLRTAFSVGDGLGPAEPTTFEVAVGSAKAHGIVTRDRITVRTGPPTVDADLRIEAGPMLRKFLAGRITATEFAASPGTVVTGDPLLLNMFEHLFRVPLDPSLS